MSCYEELLEKEKKLQDELEQVKKEIYTHENFQFLECLDTVINSLCKASNLKPYANIEIEYECENCGKEDSFFYDLSELVDNLRDLKESYNIKKE